MINILNYKLFEKRETKVDKKINLLHDLSVVLTDIGLQVLIFKGDDGRALADRGNQYLINLVPGNLIYDNKSIVMVVYDSFGSVTKRLSKSETILDFIETLSAFKMRPRQSGGGDESYYFMFDKHGSMTDKAPLD